VKTSWSPVTESNRRPSPYHTCRFRLMASGWVGLPQLGEIAVSGCVALRRPLPEAVVTCFVTGRSSLRSTGSLVRSNSRYGETIVTRSAIPVLERESPSGSCRCRARPVPRTGNLAWSTDVAHLTKRFSARCEGNRSAYRRPSSGSRRGQVHQSWMTASANRIGRGRIRRSPPGQCR